MTPVEALQLALKKEQASIQLYQKFSVEHKTIRDVLEFLVNEEQKHKKMIEGKIVELTNA